MGKLLSPVMSQASNNPLIDVQSKKKKKKRRRESQDAVSSGLSQEECVLEKASLEEGTPKKSKKKKKHEEANEMEHSSQMALVSPPRHGDMELDIPRAKKWKVDDDTPGRTKKNNNIGSETLHPKDTLKKVKKQMNATNDMSQHPGDTSQEIRKRKALGNDMPEHPGDSPKKEKKHKALASDMPKHPGDSSHKVKEKNLSNNTPQLEVTPLKARKQKIFNNNTPQLEVTSLKAKKQKTLPSARVRKKSTDNTKNEMEDDSPADDEDSDDDDDNDNNNKKERGWSKEEKVALCDRILKQRPAKDVQSCRKTLIKFNWSKVASEDHSAEECKEKFMEIYTKLQTQKTLTTIAKEAIDYVEQGRDIRKSVGTALSLWMKDYLTPERKAKLIAQGVGKKMMVTLAAMWKDLPQEKQEVYHQRYREALDRYGASTRQSKKARKKPPRPYQVWMVQQKESPEASEKDLTHSTFNNLPDLDKIPYILTSLQQCLQHMKEKGEDVEGVGQEEVVEREEEGAEEGKKKKKKAEWETHGPSKAELLMFLTHKDMPPLPLRNPIALLYRKLSSTGQLDTFTNSIAKQNHVKTQYQHLPLDKKDKYIRKHTKSVEGYKAKLEAWHQHQDDATRLARRIYMGSSLPSYLHPQFKKVPKVPKVKLASWEVVFTNVTHNDMSSPKFHNEPHKPPATTFQLFALKFDKMTTEKFKNPMEKNRARRERWRVMTPKQQKDISERWESLCQKYRSGILDYVANMDKKMRAVYLGFNRVRHYQFFKEDIYREAYPNAKYPVFALTPTKKRVSKVVVNDDEEDMGFLHSKSSTSSEEDEEDPSSSPAKDTPVSYPVINNESSSFESNEEEELIPHQGYLAVSHPYPEDDNDNDKLVIHNSSTSSEEDDPISPGQKSTSRSPPKATTVPYPILRDESSSSKSDEEEEKANNSESSDSDSSD